MKPIYRLCLFIAIAALVVVSPSVHLPSASSQDENTLCPQVVQTAWDTTQQFCEGIGGGEACYGHIQLEAQPQPNANQFVFNAEGDIVDVAQVQTLRLSAMDEISGRWGVALMRFQANLPQNQNATLVLFGNVELNNIAAAAPQISIASPVSINVLLNPIADAPIIGTLASKTWASADGRSADNAWLRVRLPSGENGWISRTAMAYKGSLDHLEIVESSSPDYGPMQAFYLNSYENNAVCPEAPASGILIQTPEGEAEVNLLINEVDIQIGSTVYFQAVPGANLTVTVVEGMARVSSQDVVRYVPAGTQLDVPMNADLRPAGPPGPVHAYQMSDVIALPLQLLERQITIHDPLTEDEIETLPTPTDASPAGDGDPQANDPTTENAAGGNGNNGHRATSTSRPPTTVPNPTEVRVSATPPVVPTLVPTVVIVPTDPPTAVIVPTDPPVIVPTDPPPPTAVPTDPPPPTDPPAEAQVTICHKGNTITVGASAVDAHINNHGDTLGACPG